MQSTPSRIVPFPLTGFCALLACWLPATALFAQDPPTVLDPARTQSISGGWQFALEQKENLPPDTWRNIRLPYLWKAEERGQSPRVGWLRFRFVLKNAPREPLVIVPGIIVDRDTAFLNGKQIAQTGGPRPADHAYDQMRRYILPGDLLLDSPDGSRVNEFLLRVVPLAGDRGGVRASRYLTAPTSLIPRELFLHDLPVLVFIVIALCVSGYFLLFFLRRRQELENLYFGLFCFGLALLFVHSADFKFWTGIPFMLLKRLEYATLFALPFLGATFFFEMFGIRKHRLVRLYWYAMAAGAALQIGITVFSADYYHWKGIKRAINEPLTFSFLAVLLVITIVRMVRMDRTAWVLFGGLMLLTSGTALDILSNKSITNLPPVMMYGFGGFVLSIAGLLSGRFVRLHKQVEDLNLNLEAKVEERTQQLSDALGHITELKVQQDGDYFLTALLIDPLQGDRNTSEAVVTKTYVNQKKHFHFKDWDSQLGGDLCITDTLILSDRRYVAFANGDAMGKSMQGAGGALVMGAMFNVALQRTRDEQSNRYLSPEKWLSKAYLEMQSLFETFNGSMFVSVIMGLIDEAGGQLYFVNAEHPDPVLLRGRRAEFIENVAPLRKIGMPDQREFFSVRTLQLQPGDIVVSGSDGRDDILIGQDKEGRIINEDDSLFLQHVERAVGHPQRIADSIQAAGNLIDDLSLLTIFHREGETREEGELGQLGVLESVERKSREHALEAKRLFKLGEVTAAVQEYARAVAANPLEDRWLFQYGAALARDGRLQDAVDQIERVTLRNPRHLDGLVALADLHRRLRMSATAREFLARAERIEPGDERVRRLRDRLSA